MQDKVIFCCSGELGFKTLEALYPKLKICLILTDFQSEKTLKFSQEKGIPFFINKPKRNKNSICEIIEKEDPKFLISCNYLFLIESWLHSLKNCTSINIHGSLLPKYRGRAPHIWSIINGETETGVTVHLIDDGCDTGDVIVQKKIPILKETTGGNILKTFEDIYPLLILKALKMLQNGISPKPQNHKNAFYFDKRTPEDGIINWNMTSHQLYNWIRALTVPYPGAFTYFKNEKVFFYKADFLKNQHMVKLEDAGDFFVNPSGFITVKTKDSTLTITEHSLENKTPKNQAFKFSSSRSTDE